MGNDQKFYGWKLVGALWFLYLLNMGFPLYGGGVGWPDFAAVARASGRFIAPRPEESTRTPTCAPKRERGSAASCI